ncbi:MAG: hypothetical protein U0183_05020 [Polyangiaceae bacterium]
MTYREPLDSAYRTIARLEAALAERDARISTLEAQRARLAEPTTPEALVPRAPVTEASSERGRTAEERTPRHPAHALVWLVAAGAVGAYVARFGAAMPTSVDDFVPLASGWHASLAGAATLLGLRDASLRRSGRSTVLDRALLVGAVVVGIPFALPVALVVITIGSPVLGLLCALASVLAALGAIVRWVAKDAT